MSKIVSLTAEARHAIRCKGPTNTQLIELLNSNDSIDHLSRQVRWLAYDLLRQQGKLVGTTGVLKDAARR